MSTLYVDNLEPNLGSRVLAAGHVVQVVQTSIPTTVTISGPNGTAVSVSGFSATITPTSTSSKILIRSVVNFSASGTTYGGWFRRNGTDIGRGTPVGAQQAVGFGMPLTSDSNQLYPYPYEYLDSPASTSALTYQLVVNNDNTATGYFNRSINDQSNNTGKASISTITLMEIAQ